METKIMTVHKKMKAGDLKNVIDLPNYDDNQLVKITVTPDEERVTEKKILSDEEINAIWDRIAGITSQLKDLNKSKTLDDWRAERLEERYGIKFAD